MNIVVLEQMLSGVADNPRAVTENLVRRYGTVFELAEAELDDLARTLDGDMSTSIYIKLAVSLASRRICDKFTFNKKHTEEEIKEYLISFFFGTPTEVVAVISIDGSGRVIAMDKVGVGVVNSSNVLPRKIIEVAMRHGAKDVIIAHNHPGGYPHASSEDVESARLLCEVLRMSGIGVISNYIVAGPDCVEF